VKQRLELMQETRSHTGSHLHSGSGLKRQWRGVCNAGVREHLVACHYSDLRINLAHGEELMINIRGLGSFLAISAAMQQRMPQSIALQKGA
jgi:hypothetical protein